MGGVLVCFYPGHYCYLNPYADGQKRSKVCAPRVAKSARTLEEQRLVFVEDIAYSWCEAHQLAYGQPLSFEARPSIFITLTSGSLNLPQRVTEEMAAAMFVSHAWLEPVCKFVACLKCHASLRQLSNQTAYWVCAYANNQHKLENEICNNPRKTSFYRAIKLNPLLLDVAATENGRAHVITDGLVGAEQQMMPLLGFLAKSRREAELLTALQNDDLRRAVQLSLTGKFDGVQLNTFLDHLPPQLQILRALARWDMVGCLDLGFTAVERVQLDTPLLELQELSLRFTKTSLRQVNLQRNMMPKLRLLAKKMASEFRAAKALVGDLQELDDEGIFCSYENLPLAGVDTPADNPSRCRNSKQSFASGDLAFFTSSNSLIVAVGSCFYTAARLDSMQQRVFKLALATEASYFQVLQPQADTSEHLIQVSTMLTNHSGGSSQEVAQPEQDLKSKYMEARCQMSHFQSVVCDPLASMGLQVVVNIKSLSELDEQEGIADNVLYFEVTCDGLQEVQKAWEMLQTMDVEIVSAHDFFAVASSRKCCRIVVSLRGYLATIFLLEKSLSLLESQRGIGDAANSLGLLDKTTAASWEASGRQGVSEFPRSVFVATALLRLLALYSSFIIAIFIHKLGSGYYSHIDEQGAFSPRLSAMALPFWVCCVVLLWEFLRSCCDTFADGSTGSLRIRPRPTQVWYRKYLGVQGRHYAFKVAALQLITVLIQALAKASLFGAIQDERSSQALNSASVHCFIGILLCNCIFPALVFAFPNCVSSRVGAAVMDAFLDFGYLFTSLWVYIDFASTDYFATIFLETFLNYASIYMCIAHILCVCRSLETADWAALFQVQHAEPMWGYRKRICFSCAYVCALGTFVGAMLGSIVLSAYLHSHETSAGPCSACSCSAIAPGSLMLERCPLRSGYFAYGAPPLEFDLTTHNITEILPEAFLADGVHSRGLFVDLLDQEFFTINSLDLGHNRLMTLSESIFQPHSPRKVRIDKLYLDSNHFTTFPAGVFEGLIVERLYLQSNNLTELHADTFHGLTFRNYNILVISHNSEKGILDMSHNKLQELPPKELPPKVFEGLDLHQLYLQNNDLTQLHARSFHGLTFGEKGILNMSHNKLQELPPKVFEGLDLHQLYLQNNDLSQLNAPSFHGFTFGEKGILNMSHNKLQELRADTFQNIIFGENGILDMSQNKLQELHADAFHGLTFGDKGILDMSQNKLQELHADAFHGLTFGDKGIVDMSQNKLQVLHADAFHGLTLGENSILNMSYMQTPFMVSPLVTKASTFGENGILDMSQNKLQELHADAFHGLTFGDKGILDMSQNKLQVLHADAFHGLTLGDNGILDMSQNKLQELHADTFHGLTFRNYSILVISHNKLQKLHADTFHGLTGEKGILDMSHNKLQELPPKVFEGLDLYQLYLENNDLTHLHVQSFYGLTFGWNGILDMSHNKLQALPALLFYGLGPLRKLKLKGNMLQFLGTRPFYWSYALEELNLEQNQLTDLDEDVFYSHVRHVHYVDVNEYVSLSLKRSLLELS
eukprot:s1130_g3.t1